MTSNELKILIDSLSISKAEFAELIDVDYRTIMRWLEGSRKIPKPMQLLCKIIKFNKMSVMQILKVRNGPV